MSFISLFIFAILISICVVSALASKPVGASVQNAQNYANSFCPRDGEIALADYMWITNPNGGTTFNVTEGQSQQVDVTLNVYVTYCAYWGSTAAKAISINAGEDANNNNVPDNSLMSGQPGEVVYPNATRLPGYRWGQRIAWGPATFSAKLDVSGWTAGSHRVCTTFRTVSIYPSYVSPSGCTTVTLTRTSPWTINGQSYVHKTGQSGPNGQKSVTAAPGNTVYWTHDMRANGNMDRNVAYRVDKSYSANKSPASSGQGTNGELFMKWTGDTNYQPGVYSNSAQLRRPITQNDVGAGDRFNGTWLHSPALCQNVSWDDGAYNNPNRLPSESACVAVPYNFNLRPSVSGFDVDKVIEQDGVIASVDGVITNDGPTKSYQGIRWQLSRFIIKAGGSLPGGADNRQDGCAYYRNVGCSTTEGSGSGAGDSSFGVGTRTVRSLSNQPMGDLAVGDRVCYGMSVMAYKRDLDNNSGNWRHSAARCAIVGKKPKVQVWGSDLSVGRYFANDSSPRVSAIVDTSVSTKAGGTKTYGSWIEYGIFASGTIRSASAAGLAGPDGNSSSSQSSWDKLTFANAGHTSASGCNGTIKFGCYTVPAGTGTIPDIAARLAPTTTTGTPLAGTVSLDGRNGTFYTNGNLTISGGTINKSNSVIIRASGTVTISGDIRYTTDPLGSLSEIPQVVIIANDIRINDNVTNVDAWLIANGPNGRIYTCGNNNFSQVLTSNTCKEKLTINGPVMAKKLYLTRTSGSGTAAASGEPAEVLNLRADAYLWAIGRSGGLGSVQTINTRELAPRF